MITGINHITIGVSNLERSFAFYVELLGCEARACWDSGAYLCAGELWLCLSLDTAVPAQDYSHLAFSVSNSDYTQSVARLQEASVTEWKVNTSEGQSYYFLDPDGHKLELHSGNLIDRLRCVDNKPYSGWKRLGPI